MKELQINFQIFVKHLQKFLVRQSQNFKQHFLITKKCQESKFKKKFRIKFPLFCEDILLDKPLNRG